MAWNDSEYGSKWRKESAQHRRTNVERDALAHEEKAEQEPTVLLGSARPEQP